MERLQIQNYFQSALYSILPVHCLCYITLLTLFHKEQDGQIGSHNSHRTSSLSAALGSGMSPAAPSRRITMLKRY